MTANLTAYRDARRALDDFCDLFLDPAVAPDASAPVPPEQLPESARLRLVHEEHMTRRLREFYGGPLRLEVLSFDSDGRRYRRHIVLRMEGGGRVVEVGLVRIDLHYVPEPARSAILQRRAPLGDILVDAGVLRRVEPLWYFRFDPAHPLAAYFQEPAIAVAYGRLAVIHCNGSPAVELLEVVADGG